MKKLARSILRVLFLVGVSAHAESVVRKDILEMTEQAERRIRQHLVDFMGPEERALVSVVINEKKSDPATDSTPDASADRNNPWVLSGDYLPASIESGFNQERDFIVDSADVSIQFERALDPLRQKEVEAIAGRVLKGIRTKVVINASLDPSVKGGNRAPASLSGPSFLDRFLKLLTSFMPIASAALVLLGLLAVGYMLKRSAEEIANGVKSIRPAQPKAGALGLSGPSPEDLKRLEDKNTGKGEASHEGHRQGPPSVMSGIELRKNLQAIERYLAESPLLFVRSVQDDATDLMGLKFLVSKVSDVAKQRMKNLMGVERILKASTFVAGEEVVGFDARGWVQELIEKIEIRKLAGGSVVEESLSAEESLLLQSAPQRDLFNVAIRLNSPSAWRVATDFMSSDFLRKNAGVLDESMWRLMVRGSGISDSNEVRSAARALIERVRVSVSENAVLSKSKKEGEDHFKRRILPSLVDSILMKELGDDDRFVEDLVSDAPDFGEILRQKVWTPSRLNQVADVDLKALFNRLDSNEKKAYLIFAMPAPHGARLQAFLPEGNSKKIVLDMVQRLNGTVDEEKRNQMRALAREFLDYLRAQSVSGQLRLQGDEKGRDLTVEVVDVDDVKRRAS